MPGACDFSLTTNINLYMGPGFSLPNITQAQLIPTILNILDHNSWIALQDESDFKEVNHQIQTYDTCYQKNNWPGVWFSRGSATKLLG